MSVRLRLYRLLTKIPFLLTLLVLSFQTSKAQQIYSKAYGDNKNLAIVYIHGGPRGNATLFEGTVAMDLAKQGFYVIVYDRRGEGRSADPAAKVTFPEAFDDLNALIKQYGLKKVNLLGHSFGGILATLYADAFAEKVDRLILVGALFAQQQTYDHILSTGTKLAAEKKDADIISKISAIRSLDKQSAQYRKQTYEVASHFGFFKMPFPTEESKSVNQQYENSNFSKANIRNDQAPLLFYKNESRVNIDTKPILKDILRKGVKVSAIYGLQDGIFSKKQVSDIRNLVSTKNFYPIENCSHYPFVDQRSEFLQTIGKIMNK